ncbi:alpha-amylase [Sphingomonas sp. Leaf339]|uniref:maltose alpha-D-glucosyltransferase n=1 Tax=Sphingomonas sp. Leaf339 TaxID=1736343 RepID=UPI0006F1FB2F|nr:maltose alpha-D-glucosyltransferase [Sphingomonas sp. Leaf339]KQU49735.1 alpha-amylase [Sphingomonas sp. Leaf339]
MNATNDVTTTADTGVGHDPLWYKDAVIYQVHVKSFFDSNNDGIGDFKGLIQKLDYIADLGVTCIWLLPFYPSPRRDDGYDIAAYRDVSEDYGTMADATAFIAAAHARGIRVVTELVINHTSDQHPWFQAARKAPPGSPERDFYVWSNDDKLYSGTRIIFLDTEKSNWTWDEEAGAYFWHRFYSHQPDLNFDNPAVLEEVLDVMRFWLDLGVDGLRLDAIPYLIERDGTTNENLSETHDVLKKIRAALDAEYPDRMLLAEANMWPEDTQQYFGDTAAVGEAGDECHMAFHFPLMPRMYMAVAQEDRFPITDIMRQTPDIPANCQWAIFLRNHDELTLEMVTDAERDYLWNTYAADRRARINLGIRRRLAPLMQRDRRRVELMNALLLTMPGTPVLYYGDEIGMGDNIHLGDRDGVRTPMQWSPDRNGGFSRADPPDLTLPAIQDPLYGFQAVNVEAQERDGHSLLNAVKRMLAVRREHPAFGRGTQRFLRPANRKILAYVREHEGDTILCVFNLGRTAQAVELDLAEFDGRTPIELTGGTPFPAVGPNPYVLTLPPYGFLWFALSAEADAPNWATPPAALEAERFTFVLRPGFGDIAVGANRSVLERDILPAYIAARRWFGAKDEGVRAVRILHLDPMPGVDDLLLAEIEVETDRSTYRYAMPFGIAWEGDAQGRFAGALALARVRRGRQVGLLTDGFAVNEFARSVIGAMTANSVTGEGDTALSFTSDDLDVGTDAELEWLTAEQSNSSMVLGQSVVLKLLRKLESGIHPDAEMVRYLTARGFEAVPPVLGEVRRVSDGTLLMLAQRFVHNQGDAWSWTLGVLERLASADDATFSNYASFAETLGRRLAEMHAVLALPTDDPAFAADTLSADGASHLGTDVLADVDTAIRHVTAAGLEGEAAEWLAENRDALADRIRQVAGAAAGQRLTRIHGDLHLGQVLVTAGDVMLIDFEGQPAKPLAERRAKDLAMRDVAGILRSFDYATAVADRSRPPGPDTEALRAEHRYARFCHKARETFLDAYQAASDTQPDVALLDLLLVAKAAYEVGYEAANRPDWIEVPVDGLFRAGRRLVG